MRMKTVIKNIFLICLLAFGTNACFANEHVEILLGNDYLITTDETVKTTFVENTDIVTLTPFFTIFNEKNVLLLHPLKVGEAQFTIFLDKFDVIFDVVVKTSKNKPSQKAVKLDLFEIMPLDAPPIPDILDDIDAPPTPTKKEEN